MQSQKIKTEPTRYVSLVSKLLEALKREKKSKPAPPNKCVWDLEREG
jgi:hypothetical protein